MKSTSERILDAATRIFARDGIAAATTRKIAQTAKVNEVTLFRHFKNKEELLRQVVMRCSKNFEHVFTEAPFETKTDLRRTVKGFATSFAAMLSENEDLIRTFFGELSRKPDLCRRLFVNSSKPARLRFIAYLEAAQKKGIVRKDVDVNIAVDTLTGMLVIGMIRRPIHEAYYSYERYTKTSLELFIKGIEP